MLGNERRVSGTGGRGRAGLGWGEDHVRWC